MEYMDLKSLLNFGLPNMPRTVIGLRKKAQRDGWQTRRRQGKGGGVEYALPAEIRAAIMKRQSDELAEKMPKTLPQVRPGTAMSASKPPNHVSHKAAAIYKPPPFSCRAPA